MYILLLNIFIYTFSFASSKFNHEYHELHEIANSNYSTSTIISNEEELSKEVFTDSTIDAHKPSVEDVQPNLNVQKLLSHLYSRGKDECWKEAKCEPLEESTCLGVKLPYSHTSLALSNLPSQRAAREALEYMTALKNLPYCWSVVQPLLCSVLFPQCNESSVQLPSMEMCTKTRGPCELFERENGWPEYLQCKKEFPPKCKIASRDFNFNTTGQCSPPLISTSNEKLWFDGIRGCAIQCADPMFTAEEHKDLQGFIAFFGGLCLACALFTVLTYLIDWKCAGKYPAVIIFFINVCFLVASICIMVQFHGNTREEVTCYSDGTSSYMEPSSKEYLSWSCYVVFFCVYYSMIAAGMWFIILGYAWHRSFKSLAAGQCQQHLERKKDYFHMISWCIPAIFTVLIIYFEEIKTDSAVGICFLSPTVPVRVGALLIPLTLIFGSGMVFLIGGLKTLVKMKLECSNIISEHANKKIVKTIIRLGIFILALLVFLVITIYCHVYAFVHQEDWKKSLNNFILCSSKIKFDGSECVMASRPSIYLYKLHLMALFGSGIIMASWCWTTNTLKAWQRFLRRVVGVGEEPVKLTKHKVIAQAFAKRNDLNNAGRLSISLQSFHSDPLGMNFEMNSATSSDVSSLFAAAIPYLMTRRGGVSGSSAFAFRRNSVDSQYSISRSVSMESVMNNRRKHRRHSLDSQMSFHVSDVERVAAMQTAARFGGQRRRKRDWFVSLRKGKKGQRSDRRNSTSDDSSMGSMILPTLNLSTNDSLFTTMMKKLNLSSEEQSFSFLKKESRGFMVPSDSEEETRENTGTSLHSFSRKYNGFKHKGNISKHIKNSSDHVTKASVGVQTSLDSLVSCHPMTHNKGCQVTTPLLQRASINQHTSNSSPSGSLTSLSETSKTVQETSFINGGEPTKNEKEKRKLSSSLSVKMGSSSKDKKKRCLSENERTHCVLDLEDVNND